jgi:hypothetical protein
LRGLLDECPVIHKSIVAATPGRAIDPADFEFIAQNSQIEAVHAFLESLPGALAEAEPRSRPSR